jgi:hypothetical protein
MLKGPIQKENKKSRMKTTRKAALLMQHLGDIFRKKKSIQNMTLRHGTLTHPGLQFILQKKK